MTAPPVENAAVNAILDAHATAAAPAGRPVKAFGLSMSPEAIRSRARRAAAKNAPPVSGAAPAAIPQPEPARVEQPAEPAAPAPAPAERFTAAHLQLVPDGPSRSTVAPEQMEKATRQWAALFRTGSFFAAKIWKSEDLKISQADARDCAEALLDGWPELAIVDDDYRKIMACATIGSVGYERLDAYRSGKRGRPPHAQAALPDRAQPAPAAPTELDEAEEGGSLQLVQLS